ncbi:MAG: CPBP family intramembrane metalloprotease [Sedimentisphaerales bacterium]|nr:CPBP family intramembrane metalloprotease [Sedimentisphaerales bacterium]
MEPISNKKAAKWIILTVCVLLGVCMVFSNIYILFWYFKTGHRGRPPADVIQRAVMYMAVFGLWFTVGLWWLIHRRNIPFTDLFGIRTDSFLKDLAVGLLLGVFWVSIYGFIGWPPFSDMIILDSAKVRSIPASLSAGFCEEFLFRGFVILMISRTGGTRRSQIIWSSLAFGLAHIFWGPMGILFTIALGATLGIARILRGNVWPAVIAHSVLNLCIEPALMNKVMSTNFQ